MANAALDRVQFEGFRAGGFADPSEPVAVQFETPWDLRRLRPHFFPRAASVVFGRRRPLNSETAMPAAADRWSGRLPATSSSWREVAETVSRSAASLSVVSDEYASPYRSRFAQGARLVPLSPAHGGCAADAP